MVKSRSDVMVVKSQKDLDYILVYPKALLPQHLVIDFEGADFKGRNHYMPVVQGRDNEYVLKTS